jgi:glycosidase
MPILSRALLPVFASILVFFSVIPLFSTTNGWWKDSVIYEIFPRSFYDSDGDGKGDLAGITLKLDYLTNLGVDTIWLNPINTCKSYHGYDVEDYTNIAKDLGTMQDFDRLLAEAHKRGIRVLLDMVFNHTSQLNPWFIRSANREKPYDNYYCWTNVKPVGWLKTWNWSPVRKEWYYSAFGAWMPDLNHFEPLVFEEIKRITQFWIDKGVDGFRLDAARHMLEDGPGVGELDSVSTLNWWVKYNAWVKSRKPDFLLVGEVWSSYSNISKYYENGTGLDMCFDFSFSERVQLAAGKIGNMGGLYDGISQRLTFPAPAAFYSPFLANHDMIRVMNVIGNNFSNAMLTPVLLLTQPGTPMLYYGEEIGMFQRSGRDDVQKRTPMQWTTNGHADGFSVQDKSWTPVVTNADPYDVECQQKDPGSLWRLYQKMLAIRKAEPALRTGDITLFPKSDTKFIAYTRTDGSNVILVVASGSDSNVVEALPGLKTERFTDLLTGKPAALTNGRIALPARGYAVWKALP